MTIEVLEPIFENLRREFETLSSQTEKRARTQLLSTLNQLVRRLRTYESESDWIATTLDAAYSFSRQVALFSLSNSALRLRGQLPEEVLPSGYSFPLSSAAAFAAAVSTNEPVTALRTANEVSATLSQGRPSERVHIFPIANGKRVSALLFCCEGSDVTALELISGIASSVLGRESNVGLHTQIAPAAPLAVPPAPVALKSEPSAKLPDWKDLPDAERSLHMRAQRFARVSVAEMQLARPEACRAGREQNDLYLFLKREIDKTRENFRQQFMTVPTMVDYLHLELVQSAAAGDEQKLGADYPGRLL